MKRLLSGLCIAATSILLSAVPVLAHGDHDARPLARDLKAGPNSISLWQVYPDIGSAMTPHLIVMFDGGPTSPASAVVTVEVNSTPMDVRPSTTTPNGWETTEGVAEGDIVAVTIAEGAETWALDPVVVPPPPTSMLPMEELIYASILLTAGTALWAAGRTTRAWRRPVVTSS
jgi:hypothetical protein